MTKLKISITIDEELLAWLNSELETKRFASISHGIEYALTTVKGMQNNQPQPNTAPKVAETEAIESLRSQLPPPKGRGMFCEERE